MKFCREIPCWARPEDLASELGFETVDAGPLTQARALEPFALLWISLAFAQVWEVISLSSCCAGKARGGAPIFSRPLKGDLAYLGIFTRR
jgi:hypothetical protein